MNFEYSDKCKDYLGRLDAFMADSVYPNEHAFDDEINSGDRWAPLQLIEDLKVRAKAAGL